MIAILRGGFCFLLFILPMVYAAQVAPRMYAIVFKDKHLSPYSLDAPQAYLSERAIERRQRQAITIDSLDLPVNENYLEAIGQFGSTTIKYTSRWMNAAVVFVLDTTVIDSIRQLPMILDMRKLPLAADLATISKDEVGPSDRSELSGMNVDEVEDFYGDSYHQIAMMRGQLLHAMGYTGQNMQIAVLDSGWEKADVLSVFDRLRNEGRLMGTRDFVFEQNDPVYHTSSHGTAVWSIMGGFTQGELVGSAYGASYYLIRTENPGSEHIAEEWNWVAGAEYADSMGVDVINSSLGYSQFDWSQQDHTYSDMDGQTTIASRGADIAASRGILVVNSAGNSGDDPWRYITAPSDADSVLAIGATWPDGAVAWFSSRGPSADGDVKPNVSAQGVGVVFAATDSTFRSGNGTSFSAPLISGLAACLWQAFPTATNMQILRAIEHSSHLYRTPNDDLGYGIPDFWRAYEILSGISGDASGLDATLWPNPSSGQCTIECNNWDAAHIEWQVLDAVGRLVVSDKETLAQSGQAIIRLKLDEVQDGVYFVHLMSGDRHSVLPWCISNSQ
ncbi:MAG: hypothetical protein RLZZ262_2355 [Bacteroidota bacterium]|jgi:serine protease AprX